LSKTLVDSFDDMTKLREPLVDSVILKSSVFEEGLWLLMRIRRSNKSLEESQSAPKDPQNQVLSIQGQRVNSRGVFL
jgi:hypothetical protein